MAAIANLVIYDNASTVHTFLPVSVTREGGKILAVYRENAASVPLEAQSTVSLSLETTRNGVTKCTMEVAVPTLESVGSQNAAGYTAPPKVAYVLRSVQTFYWHPRSTEAQRTFTRQLSANLVQGIATTVTAITTGAVPDLVDRALAPT